MTPTAGIKRSTTPAKLALHAKEITKRYGAVVALGGASLELRTGEVHGMVGDNGAGKSTFLKSLSGVVAADSGALTVNGEPVQFKGPRDALNAGIETVYQDLSLVDSMSAVHNIFLGREDVYGGRLLQRIGFIRQKEMRARATDVLDQLGVNIQSVTEDVKSMSGGQRQCLAIARALLWGRKIVILDEPTAALGVRETRQVLDLILKLKDHGVSVIVVSHNMQELTEVADRITVMRLGRSIATRDVRSTTAQEIVGLITGAIDPNEAPAT